jgi:hypothetical protein
MLEIYLLDGCEEKSLEKFLQRLVKFELSYVIRKAPKKPKRILSCYVEGAFKAAGIWGMPLERGTMRMLCASELVSPNWGQSVTVKRKSGLEKLMFASHPDPDVLSGVALHELGHTLKAVKKRTHKLVMQVKMSKELAPETTRTLIKQGTLEQLGKLHPESMVELGGSHCLEPGCIMQVALPNNVINVQQPFCQLCFDNVTEEIKKVNEEFEAVKNKCGDCIYLKKCMYTKEWVHEGADTCDEFEQDPTQMADNTPPKQDDSE